MRREITCLPKIFKVIGDSAVPDPREPDDIVDERFQTCGVLSSKGSEEKEDSPWHNFKTWT